MEGTGWKSFILKMVTIADFDLVEDHLQKYYKRDEPLHIAIGRYAEENIQYFKLILAVIINQNLSFIALDNKTGNVAGVLLIAHYDKHIDCGIPDPPCTDPFQQYLTEIEAEYDIFEAYNVEHYSEIFIASVSHACRGQGLATEMFRRSLTILENNGDTIVTSMATTPFTRRICTALNFEELKSWKFSDAKGEDGSSILNDSNLDGKLVLSVLKL